MIDGWMTVPMLVRLMIVYGIGASAGVFVNWAIYSLQSEPRPVSPWSREHPRDERSSWLNRMPVVGWWSIRHKGRHFGYDFWIRPLILEIVCGLLMAGLYHWEVDHQRLVFQLVPEFPRPASPVLLHTQFACHALLLILMLAISWIDLDDYVIPDELTVPGTCLALLFAAFLPDSRLPDVPHAFFQVVPVGGAPEGPRLLQIASPREFPAFLAGVPAAWGLLTALACWLWWCVALLPRTWYSRHGIRRAWGLCWARMCRGPGTRVVVVMGTVGMICIAGMWLWGGVRWESLLSALFGLAFGGIAIWVIRILGSWALQREAMGFGDVTLLAMIGAFLGWQAALFTFVLAPFSGAVVGLAKRWLGGDGVIPYGPFLCLGAVFTLLGWLRIWDMMKDPFGIPWLIPATVVVSLALIVATLVVLRAMREPSTQAYEEEDGGEGPGDGD